MRPTCSITEYPNVVNVGKYDCRNLARSQTHFRFSPLALGVGGVYNPYFYPDITSSIHFPISCKLWLYTNYPPLIKSIIHIRTNSPSSIPLSCIMSFTTLTCINQEFIGGVWVEVFWWPSACEYPDLNNSNTLVGSNRVLYHHPIKFSWNIILSDMYPKGFDYERW